MYPTRFEITHIVRVRTGENALGQPIYAETRRSRRVYGWQPASENERVTAALAGRTITDLILLTPDGDYNAADGVVIDGRDYEVLGDAEDHNAGPFGFAPGYSVRLRKVTDA